MYIMLYYLYHIVILYYGLDWITRFSLDQEIL